MFTRDLDSLLKSYIDLIFAFSRLLCRAALFLCKIPLSAIRSMIGTAELYAAVASSLLPLSIAAITFLIDVRTIERSPEL